MNASRLGFDAMMRYPLFSALFNRRSRRISKGIASVGAGSLSYTSEQTPQPLCALEEAVLIAATGATGMTVPDRPFQAPSGENILGTPNLNFVGRAAGSTDNCQATHFFLINDSGTFVSVHQPPCTRSVPRCEIAFSPRSGTFKTHGSTVDLTYTSGFGAATASFHAELDCNNTWKLTGSDYNQSLTLVVSTLAP